jgi:hypothetical protein
MGYQDWPQPTDAMEAFRQTEKRMQRQERRPVVQKASDLLGPGIAPHAVEVPSWRDSAAAFNGFYWTQPGATKDAPDADHFWIGQTTASSDGFGIQRVLTFHETAYFPPKVYWRQFVNVSGSVINYGTWQSEKVIGNPDSPLVSSDSPGGGMDGFEVNSDGSGSFHGATQPYYARLLDSNQSIPSGTNTLITAWSALVANSGGWTYSGGVYTCTMAGQWLVVAGVKFDPDTVDPSFRRMYVTKNGTGAGDSFAQGNAIPRDGGTDTFVQVTGVTGFSVGDTVRFYARHSHPSSVDLVAGPGLQAQFQRISA